LINERRGFGGAMPGDIDQWTVRLEKHPWLGALNDAQFVNQTVPPAQIRAGVVVPVSVTMRNAGTTVWSATAGYALGSQAPADNRTWGASRQALPHDVRPGQDVTFRFNVTAPQRTPAAFQWRMVQEHVEWFGAATPRVDVLVDIGECADLNARIAAVNADILRLQRLLATVPTSEKPEIVIQITEKRAELAALTQRKQEIGCLV
jgi:hypothetical protein